MKFNNSKDKDSSNMKKFEDKNFRGKVLFVFGLVMMVFSSCISVFAASFLYNSNEVSFNNSSSPSISSNNVQGAIDELYSAASDYSALQTRVAALEGHWYDDDRYLVVRSTGANNSGLILRDATDTNRGSFQYHLNGYSFLESRDSTGTMGKGELQIKGKPITLDATTGGTGDINLNGNVKVNGTDVSSIQTTTFTIGTSTVVRAFKWGKVVTLATTGGGSQEAARDSQTIVGTVPTGYRPAYMVEYKDNYANSRFIINPDSGTIKTQSASTNSYWRFTITYICS